MKITYEEFKIMSLRPAFNNGSQFEIEVTFSDAELHRTGISDTKALNMLIGDTVRVSGGVKIDGKDDKYKWITIYMCGEELEDFIGKYGVENINATTTLKLEMAYAVYEYDQYCGDSVTEEITGYKYIATVSDEVQESRATSCESCDEVSDNAA